MKIYTLRCELLVPVSLKETFRVFEDPANLTKITPPWMNFSIVTQNLQMRKGLEIDYRFRWLGLPMKWKTLISEYEPPFLFVDEALQSPYSLWRHRHEFAETRNGTIVRDRVEYALPLGILGQVANSLMVSKQVREIFTHRQEKIAELLGHPAVVLSEPSLW